MEANRIERIVAVDPGMTTGMVQWWIGEGLDEDGNVDIGDRYLVNEYGRADGRAVKGSEHWNHWAGTGMMIAADIIGFEPEAIVCEDFVLYPDIMKGKRGSTERAGLAPIGVWSAVLGVIGSCDWAAGRGNIGASGLWELVGQIEYQMASEAKLIITNQRMRNSDPLLYELTKGKNHARDAARHLMLYRRKLAMKERLARRGES